MKLFVIGSLILFFSMPGFAAEPTTPPWTGEAEAGTIIVSGNNDSESYNAKAKTSFTEGRNTYVISGRYLKTTSLYVESARNWDASFRYEHALTDYLSVYLGQKAESDIFNGYTQRDSTDLGLKYFLTKTDEITWTVEAGIRYQVTNPTVGVNTFDNMGRAYTEYNHKYREELAFKYLLEYLPNLTTPDAYLINSEGSLNFMLNTTFSLKFAYLVQYQNVIPIGAKYATTTTTTNLVAKF